ncbi:MAG: cob(I)yrinic acid a,c-diamide adenosyltransferase [Eubacteriales bacterium]
MCTGKVIIYTGNGKGKTTSALGLGFNRWAKGEKVLVLQFIKGGRSYGELNAIRTLGDSFKIKQMGLGFVRNDKKNFSLHKKYASSALDQAVIEITSGEYDMIILDEINYAIYFGLLTEEQVAQAIKQKPPNLTLVLTGRYVRDSIIGLADEVYELMDIKHHSRQGLFAVKGIDY